MPAFGAIKPSGVSAMTNPGIPPTMRSDSRMTSSARAGLIECSDARAAASSEATTLSMLTILPCEYDTYLLETTTMSPSAGMNSAAARDVETSPDRSNTPACRRARTAVTVYVTAVTAMPHSCPLLSSHIVPDINF